MLQGIKLLWTSSIGYVKKLAAILMDVNYIVSLIAMMVWEERERGRKREREEGRERCTKALLTLLLFFFCRLGVCCILLG